MLLSVSRSLVIVFPFYKVSQTGVLFSFLLYSLIVNLHALVPLATTQDPFQSYDKTVAYCYYAVTQREHRIVVEVMFAIFVGAPAIFIFTSFVVATIKLSRQRMQCSRNHRAAVTIALFTGTFLICNIPCFLNRTLFTLTAIIPPGEYPGPVYSNPFMTFYSWVLFDIFITALNAAVNPAVYLCRMAGFRAWLLGGRRGREANTQREPETHDTEIVLANRDCVEMTTMSSTLDFGVYPSPTLVLGVSATMDSDL